MLETLKQMIEIFKTKVPETFYLRNPKLKVTYPYMTFSYTLEHYRVGAKGFYFDVDIFDNRGQDNVRIEQCVNDLLELEGQFFLTEDLLIQIDTININNLPTMSDTLQRRTGQIYCRVDWRNK
ncbi:MAG: hypothetical protein F6I01_002165 [Aerococcus sanguinicola]